MKKIFLLLMPLLAMAGCKEDEAIRFPYEDPQFETDPSFISLEAVMPLGTSTTDAIYIVGEFNGGEEAAVGNDEWKMVVSPQMPQKWGVYLDPTKFVGGKGLSDGYYFVSEAMGKERGYDNEDVLHTDSAGEGESVNYVRVVRWAKNFEVDVPSIWPEIPANMIQLRLTVPEATPEGYVISLWGDLNGWNGGNAKWQATPVDADHYFINLDPNEFNEGASLAGNWKFAVIADGQEWWFHQQNAEGDPDTDGAGVPIEDARVGKAYDEVIPNWRNSATLPETVAPKTYLFVEVPSLTPADAIVRFVGEPNGWTSSADWEARRVREGLYLMTIDPALLSTGMSLDNKFFFAAITQASMDAGRDWWYHQNNDTGGPEEETTWNSAEDSPHQFKGAEVNKTYTLTVVNWRNAAQLESGEY